MMRGGGTFCSNSSEGHSSDPEQDDEEEMAFGETEEDSEEMMDLSDLPRALFACSVHEAVIIYLKSVSVLFGHTLKVVVVLDLTDIVWAKTVAFGTQVWNNVHFWVNYSFKVLSELEMRHCRIKCFIFHTSHSLPRALSAC